MYAGLIVTLMNNTKIKKVGYAVAGDTSKLRSTLDRALRSSVGEVGSKRQKTGDFAAIIDIREKKVNGGLAGLVKKTLHGKAIEKDSTNERLVETSINLRTSSLRSSRCIRLCTYLQFEGEQR